MKDKLSKIGEIFLTIILLPFTFLAGLVLVLYIPIDFIKCHRSNYYRDTKSKYQMYLSITLNFKIYNIIKSENLPIQYLKAKDLLNWKFYYKNTLILTDSVIGKIQFDKKQNSWFIGEPSDDDDADKYLNVETFIKEELEEFNKNTENVICDRVVALVDKNDLEDDLPQIENFDFLLPYDKKNLKNVLKKFVENFNNKNK